MERIMVALDGSEHSDNARPCERVARMRRRAGPAARRVRQAADRWGAPDGRGRYLNEIATSLNGSAVDRRATRASAPSRPPALRRRGAALPPGHGSADDEPGARAPAPRARARCRYLEDGDPAGTSCASPRGLHVDMIVLGSRGLGDVQGLLRSSGVAQGRAPGRVHLRLGEVAGLLRALFRCTRLGLIPGRRNCEIAAAGPTTPRPGIAGAAR